MGWKPNLTRRRKEKKSTCTPKVRFVWAEVGSNLAEKAFQSLSERQFVRVRSRVRAPRLPKADRFDSFCVLIATDASLQHYDTADELRLSGADTFKHSNIYIYIRIYMLCRPVSICVLWMGWLLSAACTEFGCEYLKTHYVILRQTATHRKIEHEQIWIEGMFCIFVSISSSFSTLYFFLSSPPVSSHFLFASFVSIVEQKHTSLPVSFLFLAWMSLELNFVARMGKWKKKKKWREKNTKWFCWN